MRPYKHDPDACRNKSKRERIKETRAKRNRRRFYIQGSYRNDWSEHARK
jgi:hypothetical protein